MNAFQKVGLGLVLVMVFGGFGSVLAQEPIEEGVEVDTRGPVHEAFAEPVSLSPEPGMIVSKPPPEAIEEIPPDEKPNDENVIWVPGYWGWDDDRGDFVWISGIWRVPPPNYTWVPGYWTQVENGFQWIPGLWMPQETRQIEYLPPPPATIEIGPSTPMPSPDHSWVPGSWFWRESRYAWRPGYWLRSRPEWVWVPAHYIWTPRGVIFTEGYWDYPVARRGVLFAPVYIQRKVLLRPHFAFSPSIVINTDLLTAHLFSRPKYDHYYFGDYYSKTYERRGIVPWFQAVENHRAYDPIIVHQQWRYGRNDPHWIDRARSDYRLRVDNKLTRPARTLTDQRTILHRLPERDRNPYTLAKPLREFATVKNAPMTFEKVNKDRRDWFVRDQTDLKKFRDQRVRWESQPTIKPKPGSIKIEPRQYKPQDIKVPNMWTPRKPASNLPGRAITLPPRPQMPKLDTNVKPRTLLCTHDPHKTQRSDPKTYVATSRGQEGKGMICGTMADNPKFT